jgi:hypothetical protein
MSYIFPALKARLSSSSSQNRIRGKKKKEAIRRMLAKFNGIYTGTKKS